MPELAEFHRRERCLQRSAASHHDDLAQAARPEPVERMVGDIGLREDFRVADQDPRHVERDIAVADHHGAVGGQIGRHLAEMRVGVVPADEVDGGDAAGQIFAGDAELTVGLGADRVDHRVVPLGQLGGVHMLAHGDVAEEPKPRVRGDLLELRADRLDLRVIRCDAGADQSPRCGQHLQHVDPKIAVFVSNFQQRRGGKEPGRA